MDNNDSRGVPSRKLNPYVSLLLLLLAVSVAVVGAGLASLLLLRAGYGFLVWGLVPLLALLAVSAGLGVILARATGALAGGRSSGTGRRGQPRG